MERHQPIQLELPEVAMTAAERKQWIRERLHGYEYRQAVREDRRKEATERRRVKSLEGQEVANKLTQASIPSQFYRRVN